MDMKELRESLTIEDINFLLGELGGAPLVQKGVNYITETLCHHFPGEGSHKLYYYPNTHLWQCYTGCQASFDIFELIVRHKNTIGEQYSLTQAIRLVKSKLGYDEFDFEVTEKVSDDWKIINRYKKGESASEKESRKGNGRVDVPYLNNISKCIVTEWVRSGISPSTHIKYGIRYYPVGNCIIIPHFNRDGELIGVRQRTLEESQIQVWGKYRPARIGDKMYNHHLGYELYGLNHNKENIQRVKKAIVFEGEKSVMMMDSLLGENANISVACCGSNISKKQVDLLLEMGVGEMIVAFDKEYNTIGDADFKRQVKMFTNIHKRFSPFLEVSFMFDKEGILNFKSSPIDEGLDKFLYLFNNRVYLEE